MSAQQTRNRGATKAGDGRFLFDFAELARMPVGEGYSTAEGPVVEGERMHRRHARGLEKIPFSRLRAGARWSSG